jgi:cytochrome c oxidase cbb3-type subunit IV
MLKFIKHNLETITGIDIFPVIALLIFFTFFIGLTLWVMTYNKKTISELSNIPLDDDIHIDLKE